jgi:ketopantoate reductase
MGMRIAVVGVGVVGSYFGGALARGGEDVVFVARDLGPGAILVALTLAFRRDSTTDMIEDAIREITQALQKADGRIAYVYVRPSDRAHQSSR